MKPSRYNIYVKAASHHSFVYNTLTNSLLLVDSDLQQCLEKDQLEKIDPSVMDSLRKCGILVDSGTDELEIFRLNHNTAKYDTNRSSFLIFTTFACNLSCPYCYEGAADAECRSAFMSPETTADVVKFICSQTAHNKSRAVGVALYGGEPLLNRECCETVLKEVSHWCEDNSVSFYATLLTNGCLLTEEVYTSIGRYLSYIHITLDGPQHFHDRKRVKKDGSGTYSLILQNLNRLKDTKEHLSIRVNIDEENRHSIGEVLDDLEELGLKGRPHLHVYFSQIIPQNRCLTFSSPESDECNPSDYFPDIMQMTRERGWGAHLTGDPTKNTSKSVVVACGYVTQGTYSIDPGGDVYLCPAVAGNPQYRTGTVGHGSCEWYPLYYDIITRDPSLTPPCHTCELLPLCGGGCPLASLAQDNKTECSSARKLYGRLKAYLESRYPERF